MVRDRAWGIWGELKERRQIENERFGCPSQVFYFARVLEVFYFYFSFGLILSFSLGLYSQRISVFSNNRELKQTRRRRKRERHLKM